MSQFKNSLIIAACAASLLACSVEKTGEDTYQVQTPDAQEVQAETREAAQQTETALENAGQEIREGARAVANSEAAQDAKEGAKELGREAAAAGREAANATGTALERAGKEMQQHSKPGDQP